MERRLHRRSMRLARNAVPSRELALHLAHIGAAKPGWKPRNWIMNQEWFDVCAAMGWPGGSPGILWGVHVTVSESAGFPRIERYLRTSA